MIWTTTPWTLPANLAVCVHPELTYVVMRTGQERYLVGEALLESFTKACGIESYEIEQKIQGKELEGVVCRHPFLDRDSIVILGEHVTTDAGTGCVHTAPGHGMEDFEAGKKYGLDILCPVDDKGRFTKEGGPFEGMFIDDANPAVLKTLAEKGLLLAKGSIRHQYPHCWRCKNPIIYRAAEQWFVSIDGFRQEALKAIDEKVRWIPAWGRDRIHNMIADRGDWCISRSGPGVCRFLFSIVRTVVRLLSPKRLRIILLRSSAGKAPTLGGLRRFRSFCPRGLSVPNAAAAISRRDRYYGRLV